jgi:hypothetical protein
MVNDLAQQVWTAILPVLATALVSILIALISSARQWVLSRIGSERHAKAAGIVMDAVFAAANSLGPKFITMMADGKLSPDEKAALKAEARQIALSRLSSLRGFVVAEAGQWVEDQIDASLGKLLTPWIPQGGGTTIGPDDPAV